MLSGTARADEGDSDWLGLKNVLWSIFKGSVEKALEWLDWLTATIANKIPAGWQDKVDAVADYAAAVNKWLPIDTLIFAVIAYYNIVLICMAIKFVWSKL